MALSVHSQKYNPSQGLSFVPNVLTREQTDLYAKIFRVFTASLKSLQINNSDIKLYTKLGILRESMKFVAQQLAVFFTQTKDNFIYNESSTNRKFFIFHNEIQSNRDMILVRLNKKRRGENPIGFGSYKKVQLSVDLLSGNCFAALISQDLTISEFTLVEELMKQPGSERYFISTHAASTYVGKEEKTKLLIVQDKGLDLTNSQFNNIPLNWRFKFALNIVEALVFLHERTIVHRDIKLQNCLLVHDQDKDCPYRAVLIDFGFACKESSHPKQFSGTYIAPEYLRMSEMASSLALTDQEEQKFNDPKCIQDIWGLGLLLTELLRPFLSEDFVSPILTLFNAPLHQIVDNTRTLKQDWLNPQSSLENIVASMLQTNPKKRLSAQDALNKLKIIFYSLKNVKYFEEMENRPNPIQTCASI
jgi:serine/threonine protein kinase